ncbi:protein bric-a-brac 1-like isoform X2 [Tigriopus californicus]|nr:protein bric-a-brac 1-like isoform X2 [Tigriopus californicus]
MFRASPIPPRPRSPPPQEGSPGPLKINEDPMSPRSEHDANPISSSQDKDDPQQHYCLKWNNYQTNLTSVFDHLLQTEAFVDVTLTSEGQVIKCHKVVLSACSPYFQSLLSGNPSQHPIVILRDIPWADLKYIVEYMYRGEINVGQDELPSVLKSSEALNIRGLVDFRSSNQGQLSSPNKDVELKPCSNKGPPPLIDFRPHKRKRTSSSSFDEPNVISPSLSRPEPTDPHSPYHTREDCSALEMGLPLGPPSMSSSFQTRTSHPARSPSSSQSTPQGAHSAAGSSSHSISKPKNQIPSDDLSDVKPGIMELIQEERRAKLLEASQITHSWMNHHHHQQQQQQQQKTGASGTSLSNVRRESSPIPGSSSCYQYQLQSMWQKCWNQNASALQSMRYRERGPMKSWRPETMAEAIWSVLQDGLSLSQAARKHDIPYPTFVLYANRVHNMLGPSVMDGSPTIGELRPKGRGRPQRILLGNWPEEHVRQVIRAVVFRDGTTPTYGNSHMASSSSSTLASRTPANQPHSSQGRRSPTLSMRGSPLSAGRRASASSTTLSPIEEAGSGAVPPPGCGNNLSSAQEQLAAQFQQIYSNHLNQFAHSLGSFGGAPTTGQPMVKPEKENLLLDHGSLTSFLSPTNHPSSHNFEDADDECDGHNGETMIPSLRKRDLRINPSSQTSIVSEPDGIEHAHSERLASSQLSSFEGTQHGKRDLDESIIKLRERRMKMMMMIKGQEEGGCSENRPLGSGTVQTSPCTSSTTNSAKGATDPPRTSMAASEAVVSVQMSHDPMNLANSSWNHCSSNGANISPPSDETT